MYEIIINNKTLNKLNTIFELWKEGQSSLGMKFLDRLNGCDKKNIELYEFLECLLNTKSPQIYAESEVYGDGSDWTKEELAILGDVSISVPVTVFNDGAHQSPQNFESTFPATLVYVCGTLLRNDCFNSAVDFDEVVEFGEIQLDKFFKLYERRLLPVFEHINALAEQNNRKAVITIPGLGCGMFAGVFQGELGEKLESVLLQFLKKYHSKFSNIRAIYFDPFNECENLRIEVGNISFMTRPYLKDNHIPQLRMVTDYEDSKGEFDGCELYSLVAWDHVSWPGNDYYIGQRETDDGVKSASTDSMYQITGVKGIYNSSSYCYEPSNKYKNWRDVISKNNIKLESVKKMNVYF